MFDSLVVNVDVIAVEVHSVITGDSCLSMLAGRPFVSVINIYFYEINFPLSADRPEGGGE